MKTLTPDWTKTGYQFDGWYTGENGTGTYYAAGADIKVSTTLYAHWVDENLSFTKYAYEVGYSVDVKSDKKSTVKNITIPSVWKGVAVTVVDNFMNCSELISVVIPSSVTKIDYYGFEDCAKLKTINFPESLTLIDHDAFEGCSSLEKIEIKGNLTEISYEAFRDCTSLKEVILPASIEKIDDNAFRGCTALASIDLSGTKVKSIGVHVFDGCTALSSINLPSTLESIGNCAFMKCTSLRSINIPKSVTSIHSEAFTDCTNLTIKMEIAQADAPASLETNSTWGATNSKLVWGVKIYRAGDTIEIGKYPDYYDIEDLREDAITWNVLYVNSADEMMLVISENVLEEKAWDTVSASCKYSQSTIYYYLYGNVFSDTYSLGTIASQIIKVDTSGDNISVGSGTATESLFLLSESEVETYFGTNSKTATYNGTATSWWLRSYELSKDSVSSVNASGNIDSSSRSTKLGLRPAMWLSTRSN